ncbi:MAG: IS630 family transposase [Candidatus Synoicihabitans palmerolidicus]|nr:IS630 family transposase [Candidatus Synoicihabitans palmerolidicus]
MARPVNPLIIDAAQHQELEQMIKRPTTPQREVRRARIVLLRAEGKSQETVAAQIGVNRPVVAKWEKRFREAGLVGWAEARRSGQKPSVEVAIRAQIVTEVTQPPTGRTRWSSRAMAKAKGVSAHTVQRLWRANDLKPHLRRTFKLSRDRNFEAKFWDVIGLYLNPPDRALVLCCDKKSQCQALERTQPGLPLGIGHITTATHDYTRHGTVTLFAALGYLDGKIMRRTASRHTHREGLGFLQHILLGEKSYLRHRRVPKGQLWLGTLLCTAGIFLLLPFTQMIASMGKKPNDLFTVEVAAPPRLRP